VPTAAQDRGRRGPLAALLILLSLVLGSATAAGGADLRGPSARLGSSRHVPAAAVLPAGARSAVDEEIAGSAAGSSVPPTAPGIVTERLRARPAAGFRPGAEAAVAGPASASYRARAPPAI